MKKIFTKEVVIAIVTITVLIIFYVGLNYLKGINVFKPTNHYYVTMPNVAELQKSSPVYVDGFKVGLVSKIMYDYSTPDTEHILIELNLDKKMKIQTGSYAELKSSMTAGAYIDLILNKYVSAYYNVGDTLKGERYLGLMDKLSEETLPQVEAILPRLDSILMGIQNIVNHPALSRSLTNIETITADLQRSSNQLNQMLSKDIPIIMADLKSTSSNFNDISKNIKSIDFDGTVNTIESAVQNLDKLTQQVNSADNSLGLLLNDASLYNNLDSTARNAADLLKDIKENPKNYVHFSVF